MVTRVRQVCLIDVVAHLVLLGDAFLAVALAGMAGGVFVVELREERVRVLGVDAGDPDVHEAAGAAAEGGVGGAAGDDVAVGGDDEGGDGVAAEFAELRRPIVFAWVERPSLRGLRRRFTTSAVRSSQGKASTLREPSTRDDRSVL